MPALGRRFCPQASANDSDLCAVASWRGRARIAGHSARPVGGDERRLTGRFQHRPVVDSDRGWQMGRDMAIITDQPIERYAVLRALVGFLGESPQHSWWDTNFLSRIGQQFMAINFPRTALAAACSSVTVAARRVHDQHIGKGGVKENLRG